MHRAVVQHLLRFSCRESRVQVQKRCRDRNDGRRDPHACGKVHHTWRPYSLSTEMSRRAHNSFSKRTLDLQKVKEDRKEVKSSAPAWQPQRCKFASAMLYGLISTSR